MGKKILNWLIVGFGILMIIGFSRDILRLLKADDRIDEAKERLAVLQSDNQDLKQKEEYFQSEEFVEQEARNRLNMSREGETVVLLPPNLSELVQGEIAEPPPELPNWKKWWELFF